MKQEWLGYEEKGHPECKGECADQEFLDRIANCEHLKPTNDEILVSLLKKYGEKQKFLEDSVESGDTLCLNPRNQTRAALYSLIKEFKEDITKLLEYSHEP